MFSINSFHDLVILVSLNLNRGTEDLSLPFYPPLTLFFLFLQTLFCSRSKGVLRLQCHHKASPPFFFFVSGSSRPTIQSTCDSLLLLSGNPITPTIYLSSSHSILCLCLFNTRWSCLPGIGCLMCDAERFPIDGMERMGRREGRVSRGYRIGGEKRRGRTKCFGPESIEVDYLPQTEMAKVEWKLKRLQWSAGNLFFMRNCSFAPVYWTAVLKSFLLQKAIEFSIRMMSWTLFGFH